MSMLLLNPYRYVQPAPPAGVDPHWAKIFFLLNMKGENGSTDIINSRNIEGWTSYNGASIQSNKLSTVAANDEYIKANGTRDHTISGDFTIEFVFKANTLTTNQYLFAHGNNGLVIQIYQGIIRVYSANTGISGPMYNNGPAISADVEYKVVLVRAGSTMSAYVDDVQFATQETTQTFGNDTLIFAENGSLGVPFDGLIGPARGTRFARYDPTQTTIVSDSGPYPVPELDPLGSYVLSLVRFTDPDGTTIPYDDVPGITWSNSGGGAVVDRTSSLLPDGGLHLTGGYIQSSTLNITTGPFCVEGSFIPTDLNTRGIFHTNPGGNVYGIGLGYYSGFLQIYHQGNDSHSDPIPLTLGQKYRYAVERDDENIVRLMWDGVVLIEVEDASDFHGYGYMCYGIYYSSGYPSLGYMGEQRITQGAFRYGGAYTPSDDPFLPPV